MKNTQPPIDLQKTIELQTELWRLFDEDFKKTTIYDSKKIEEFNKKIYSKETGIPAGTPVREVERILQTWYELLTKAPKFANANKPNDMPAKTTWNKDESAQFQEEARIRNEQITATRENQTKLVEDFIKQNEERIAKAKSLQEKLKDKVLYAKVVIPEEEKLTQDEQKELEVLIAKAKNDTPVVGKVLTPKQELIDDFTLEIEKKLEPVLKDLPEKEREIIARTYAVEIVDKIANPEAVVDERVQTVILDNIAKPKQQAVTKILQKDDELITLAKNGAVLIATKQNDDFSTLETITTSLVGPKIASKILGSQNYQVIFSEVQVQGETTHIVRFGELNQQNIHELTQENGVLTTLQQHGQQFGYEKINSVFTNYAGTFLKGKVESLPAGSVIKKAYKDPIVQSIFARYGMAKPIVWQAVGQSRFVGLVMKVAPDTAGPILGLVGKVTGKQIVAPIATKVAGQVAVKTGITATLSTTLAAAGAAIPVPVLNVILAAAGWVIGELFSKAKVWWQRNKEKVKPVLAIGATIAAIRFLGVGPGLGVGAVATFGLMGTAGLATIATGAVGVLGFIGRSIGVAIATPVIVTLLVIPPLVAFIMLVINNSAYVVPPSPLSSTSSNPYIEIIKTADPAGPFENSDLPLNITYTVTIKAKRENLTNIKITDTCRIIQEASTIPCGSPSVEVPISISPSLPFTFTYSNAYNKFTVDALVVNTIEVTADTQSSANESTIGSASITIGTPPSGCLEPSGDWPPDKWALVENTLDTIRSKYPGYLTKVCDGHPDGIPVIYNRAGSARLWGYWSDPTMTLYPLGLANGNTALYVLSHELLHALMSSKYYSLFKEYEAVPGIKSEVPRCFYTYNSSLTEERLGEAVAFSIMPNQPCSLGGNSNMNNWPKHRDFVLQKILR